MRDVRIDFPHHQSAHCESGVTSNLLKFYGLDITEPMAFGIGTGIYFSYIPFLRIQYAPMISFRNLPNKIFHRGMKYLGVDATVVKKFRDPRESMDALDRNLENGIPTGLQVGLFNLTYFPPEYRMHYNMHNIVVYGKEGNNYLISDPSLEEPQTLTYGDLLRVRWAKGTFSAKGKMYWINRIPANTDLKGAIMKGIAKTVYEMTEVPFPLIGTKGLRILAKDLKKWPAKLGDEKASFYLGQILRMSEDVGTGGAGFRYLYGDFLGEAATVLNNPAFHEISDEVGDIANKWRDFSYLGSRNIKMRAKPEESYDKLAGILLDIANQEEKIFKKLSKI